ncbi:GATA-domain-containing protein [Pilatotrama ljubarskyi]|nr:GATA-domain-containing protein [Pilatotrama ljubarskyi]
MSASSSSLPAALPDGGAQAQQQQGPPSPVKEIPVFEFTKRKRWADLLITELNDTIILVLSETCQVWYCGSAVTEMLGWRDDELVDGDLVDLMNADDRAHFRSAFSESVRSKTEMLVYARLQCKNEFFVASDYTSAPREVLFEIRGRPHFLPDTDEFKCYFAMAQPYPSRNTAMLNTFLELKMENERLQQRVAQLRAQSQALDVAGDSFFTTSESFGATDGSRAGFDLGATPLGPDADEDGPRKKAKRIAAEQHVCVTCGRTDSPEWRKGPQGPKTLCNACGLRWAKKARKNGEMEGDSGEATAAQGSGSGVF